MDIDIDLKSLKLDLGNCIDMITELEHFPNKKKLKKLKTEILKSVVSIENIEKNNDSYKK